MGVEQKEGQGSEGDTFPAAFCKSRAERGQNADDAQKGPLQSRLHAESAGVERSGPTAPSRW